MIKVFVPLDSAALSVGAEEVALEIAIQAANNKVDIQIIRTGSRGMLWLEPLVEVETAAGRVGYCNVSVELIPDLMAADFLSGNKH
jgi:formate dehydrogenase iron-sulfur subunit